MLAKFSVKKPFTVLVAVVLILVLGVVSFMNMTPSLMPNMELPYIMVITTYAGATPEEVETEVTKPIEERLATVENVKNITSSSSENYSLVNLEFTQDADMDTVVIDIREKLNLLESGWNEYVGTPNIMKINMDMLPVTVASVNMEGMDTLELSAFAEEELIMQLEGIEGIASVSMGGIIREELKVVLDEDRLAEKNLEIRKAIDKQFEESEQELADARQELEDGEAELEDGKTGIKKGKDVLSQQQKELAKQMAQAKADLDTQRLTLLETKMMLTETEQKALELETTKATLEKTEGELTAAKEQMETLLSSLKQAKEGLDALNAAKEQMLAAAMAGGMTQEQAQEYLTQNSVEYQAVLGQISAIEGQLAAYGVTAETLEDQINQANIRMTEINEGLTETTKGLTEVNMGLAQMDGGLSSMNITLEQVEAGILSVDQAKAELFQKEAELNYTLFENLAALTAGESVMDLSSSQLDGAEESIDSAEEQIEDARESAYESADLKTVLTETTLSQILTAQNFAMPAGYAEDAEGKQWMVGVGDVIADAEELENLVLMDPGLEGVDPVVLSDVADVVVADNSDAVYAKLNGVDGVLLSFQKQSDVATATAANNVAAKFEELSEKYQGLTFVSLLDQGMYIRIVIRSVLDNLWIGAVLAILILLVFLKDLRPTGIVAVSIPVSVVFAIVLMYFSGVTLNMISLSGLAVGVGMLVDNSIVAIENIYRLRRMGLAPFKAAISGAAQVSGALVASTLTTVCVFVPIVFIEGMTRQIFQDLALTVAYSLLASLAVALTVVPAMASGMFRRVNMKEQKGYSRLAGLYEKTLKWSLSHKALCLIAAVVLLAASAGLVLMKGFSYMPAMESTQIMASVILPEDYTLEDTVAVSEEIAGKIGELEGVADVGAMLSGDMASAIGLSADGGSTAVNEVSLYVVMEEGADSGLGTEEKMEEIFAAYPQAEASIMGVSSMTSMVGGDGNVITVDLYGTDLNTLQESAGEIAEILAGVEGVIETSDGIGETTPKLMITVDKNKAMEKGLTTAQIFAELSAKLADTKMSSKIDDKEVTVVADAEIGLEDIRNYEFTVTDREGEKETILLSDIAECTETTSMATISRMGQRRYLQVTATLEEGRNLTLAVADAEKALADYDKDGITYLFTGENQEIMDAMKDLLLMLLLGIVIVYLIMVAQFQSLLSPFIVMFTIPLAFTGGFLALLICNMNIDIVAMVGFVMLVGIIVNNGIVLIDYINTLRRENTELHTAVVEGCVTRLRPVLMTAITTILGLVPMALALGTGATMTQPMAVACIGGLTYATFMTLYIVPILYDSLCKKPLRTVTGEDEEISEL